jgi:hypothetical protein
LHHRLEFQFESGPDSSRHGNRPPHADHRGDGARNHGGLRWQSHRRLLHRQSHTPKKESARAPSWWPPAPANPRVLLLNSKSAMFPNGLANSSGTVGRYLTDSVGSSGWGIVPALEKMPPHNHDGTGGMHMYIPWWKFDRKNDFPRGYHIEIGGGRDMPGCGHVQSSVPPGIRGLWRGAQKQSAPILRHGGRICGARRDDSEPRHLLRDRSRRRRSVGHSRACAFIFAGRNTNCARRATCRKLSGIVEAMGGEYQTKTASTGSIPLASKTAEKSFTKWARRAWARIPNFRAQFLLPGARCEKLFVADGAPLVTNPDKNPTLTILALSWRASEYLLDEAKKGNL